MIRPRFTLLLALLVLPACQTTRRAAVSTFRVIDAPHEYMRRQLGLDSNDQQGTTTTTTTQTNVAADNVYQNPPVQNNQQTAPPPPPSSATQRRVVTTTPQTVPTRRQIEETPSREPEEVSTPTPAPHVTSRSTTSSSRESAPESTPTTTSTTAAQKTSLPYAKPVPGKAGYVFSPYDKNGGYVDVTGFAPGSKVKDPYSGKVFLVP